MPGLNTMQVSTQVSTINSFSGNNSTALAVRREGNGPALSGNGTYVIPSPQETLNQIAEGHDFYYSLGSAFRRLGDYVLSRITHIREKTETKKVYQNTPETNVVVGALEQILECTAASLNFQERLVNLEASRRTEAACRDANLRSQTESCQTEIDDTDNNELEIRIAKQNQERKCNMMLWRENTIMRDHARTPTAAGSFVRRRRNPL